MTLAIPVNLFFRKKKAQAVYFAIAVSVIVFLMYFFKLYYAEPRPFWASDGIKAFDCSAEYGNPSGHTMNGFGFTLILLLDFFETNTITSTKRAIYIVLMVLFGSSVGFSRAILGSHSLDQILFGFMIGVWIALTFHYVFRERLMSHLNNMVSRIDQQYY